MSAASFLRRIYRTIVQGYPIHQKKHKTYLLSVDKGKSLSVDQSTILLKQNDKEIVALDMKRVNATFTPLTRNLDRVTLLTDGVHNGLKMFYYRSKNENVLISANSGFVSIHESMVVAVIQALRKYQKRKFDVPKPRPSGVDYPPPPEGKKPHRGRR